VVRQLLCPPGAALSTLVPKRVTGHIASLKWSRKEYAAKLKKSMGVDYLKAPSEDFAHYPRVFSHWLGLSGHLSDRMRRTVEGRLGITMAELRGGLLAPRMSAPLLVVHDEDDVDVPWQDGKTYVEAWPESTLLTTSGLGHRRILREPEVMKAVAAFIRGDSSPR
jgi:pimeloyl-ACP methyl ester carboxylesterase